MKYKIPGLFKIDGNEFLRKGDLIYYEDRLSGRLDKRAFPADSYVDGFEGRCPKEIPGNFLFFRPNSTRFFPDFVKLNEDDIGLGGSDVFVCAEGKGYKHGHGDSYNHPDGGNMANYEKAYMTARQRIAKRSHPEIWEIWRAARFVFVMMNGPKTLAMNPHFSEAMELP